VHRTDIHAIWLNDSVQEITAMIRETGMSRFPVYEDDLDHIIGTVTTRDFLLNQQLDNPLPLASILRKAIYVPDTVRTDVLFRNMQENKYHMAIVVDEYGGTAGLITMEDLLEEIVGNIYDEYDPQDQQPIVKLGENRWRVAGTTDIETVNEETGLNLPEEESYDTVGGMLLKWMDAVPEDGTQPDITENGIHFRVTEIQDRRIEWVEVTRVNEDA
ncbi:MAG: HlyC/CorC family transporter, partial [Clostridiales bacterium]|nr:HlyC/CorC family transporter [Clostridiales bacterium]